MAKLNKICKRRKESKSGKRFYTSIDMSELKHMIAIRNSQVKRGDVPYRVNSGISVCGCGAEGCFILYGYDNK